MRFGAVIAVLGCALAACGSSSARSSASTGSVTGGSSGTGSVTGGSSGTGSVTGGSSGTGSVTGGSSGTGRVATAAPCGPPGARTLAEGRRARVYVARGLVRGCVAGSRRTWPLASAAIRPGQRRIGAVVVREGLAAYALTSMGVDTTNAEVLERRLSDGRVLFDGPASTALTRPESFVSVPAIVLARDGSVAWTARVASVMGGGPTTQVVVWARGRSRVLDPGPSVVGDSLRLLDGRLSWRDGTARRSARMP